MIFLDINTFYSPKAGGIRTYHQAKIAWFRSQSAHRYFLVSPGPSYRVQELSPTTNLVEAFGPAVTGDKAGYRLLLDYWRIFTLIWKLRPEVLEAGDPWLTGLFCLALKKSGFYKGLLVSFYHSDPVPSYLEPWSRKGRFKPVKRLIVKLAGRLFYRIQNAYDLTAVSSRTMEISLRKCGVGAIAYLPFGVPELFLSPPPAETVVGASGNMAASGSPGPASEKIRLLYAGRLDHEKGVDLLLDVMAELLTDERVEISVLGRGSYAPRFAAWSHPRFHYLGFRESQAEVMAVYDEHQILLAPGPFETFGLGVLEAMARGLVVVGPDQGGTGEMLRQAASPYIFRSGDAQGFLLAIRSAMNGSRVSDSGKARDLAREYGSWGDAIARMANRYSQGKAGI